MKKSEAKIEVAYICNGKVRNCTKVGCYYKNHGPCMHTRNPRYAKNGTVTDPRKYPERFEHFKANHGEEVIIRYYERSNQDDQ